MFEHTVIVLASIALAGVACQWLAWWLKLPAILFLLLAGIIAGPLTEFLQPDTLFGDLLFPLISLGVAVVLFEGSLTLKLHEITGIGGVVRNLVSFGLLLNGAVIAVATHLLLGFSWAMAALFGAVVVVTGPTVIMPLLRTMRPTANIANILRWEAIIVDPLGALLAVLVFEFVVSGQEHNPLITFATMLLSGGGIGIACAYLLAIILRRHLMPGYLINVTTLALVLGSYTLANTLAHESGLLAVTVMGITLANMKDLPIKEVVDFKESLSTMMLSVLFIILAARIEFAQLFAPGAAAIALLAVILFVARPLTVLFSTIGSKLSWRERVLLGWVAPRGIVAAAVAALFSLRLADLGFPEASLLVPLTFLVIIATVLLHSATARPLADLLRVSEPEPRGVLIVGANNVARAIAKALADKGFRVMLTDTSWDDISQARMDGLATYFGNAVSEHADRNLDLVGIGRMLAMSRRPALNALACLRYKSEFGDNHVYSLLTPEEKRASEKSAIGKQYVCTRLFGADVTLAKLASLLAKNAEVRTTHLTENFTFADYLEKYQGKVIPLFAVTPKDHLRVFTAGDELAPQPGWSVVGLLPAEVVEQLRAEAERTKAETVQAEPSPA